MPNEFRSAVAYLRTSMIRCIGYLHSLHKTLRRPTSSEPSQRSSDAAYYENVFVLNPNWSKATPNADEQARWICVKDFLDRYFEAGSDKLILDVGCGRGWMTNLLSVYGTTIGVEPVGSVVEHARRLFPALRFETTIPPDLYAGGGLCDAIISSEVIEHVIDKHGFLRQLHASLKPGGILVVTTPRGELYGQWSVKFGRPGQPIEEWVTTDALLALLRSAGFEILESTTAFELGIYQVHVCRSGSGDF
jgi:2-polyprenyl-3-methyl-5-hydroxy-6-metoxy-1,4-benzoquinol methylase